MTISISNLSSSNYVSFLKRSAAPAASGQESASTSGTANEPESTTVSLSAAAVEAARNAADGRLKLPDGGYWTRKDFPDDIVAEAKARLAERQAAPGVGDGYLPSTVANLPLLPENEALMNQFRQEMKAIGHNNSDPAMNARFNQLLNLTMRLQLEGWKAPMNESDVQRELDIQQAMAVLDPAPAAPTVPSDNEPSSETDHLADPFAGWKMRWQQEGLRMPTIEATPGKSMWLTLADKAGISEDTFVTKARELAAQFKGNALTQAIEQFISDRYVATEAASAIS